eukprot:TRINITY_DN1436_c0_g2_i1.p1 TRINITY_DN1436_c0_g2~~TRINITY_DN1436_c0_g2_i1.p1  ORF type:complete len:317 (+),score=43.52 TRINITY_DN1436_c0_g2_i1:235-1185(+)
MIEGLSDSETHALTRINVAASVLSFCGSFFIVLCYALFKELRKFSFKLVFFLSLSDMCWSVFNMVGDPGEGFMCYLQGYTTQFFSVASFLWTTTIAFTLYRTVVKHKADVEGLHLPFHLYVWGTSFVMTVIPMLANDYGPAGAWCWVQNETLSGKLLRFVTFYLPLWAAIIFNGSIYFQVIRMLNFTVRMAAGMSDRSKLNESVKIDPRTMTKWGYYPVILIACWAFGTINRIQAFVEPSQPVFWLYCLHIATGSLMGLVNAVAYGLNASVRRTLREKFQLILPEKWMAPPTFQKLDGEVFILEDSELTAITSSPA